MNLNFIPNILYSMVERQRPGEILSKPRIELDLIAKKHKEKNARDSTAKHARVEYTRYMSDRLQRFSFLRACY